MLFFQNLFRLVKIETVAGFLIPGKLKQRFQICALHRAFRTASRHAFEPGNLLADFLFHFLARFQLFQRAFELFHFGKRIVFAQFFSDIAKLLPQHIFFLILVYPLFYLHGQPVLHLDNFRFARQNARQYLESFLQKHRPEHLLLFLKSQRNIDRNLIEQAAQIAPFFHLFADRSADLRKTRRISGKFLS